MKKFSPLLLLMLVLFFDLAASPAARACAACYGDTSGSKMGIAASWGIFAMVIIMFAMLGTIGLFIWHLVRRSRNPLPDYSELLREEEGTAHSTPGAV